MRESDPDDSAQDASPRKKKGLYSHSPMDILSDIRKKHGRQKGIHADEKQHSISQPEDKQFGHEERSLSDYFPPEEEENNEFKPIEVREILPREKEEELPESPSIRQKVESILKSPKRVVIEKTPSKMTEYGTNSLESYDLSAKDFGEKEEQETRNEDYDYAKPGKQKGEFEEISGADSYDNKADEEDEFDAEESEDKEKTIHDYDLDEDDFEPRVRDALSEFEERKLENFEAEQKIENLPPPPMLPKAGKGRRMRAAPSKKYSDEEGKSKKSIENYGLSKEDFESEGEFDKGRLGKERKEFEDSSQSGEEFGEEEEKTLHDYDLDEKDFEKQDSARLFSSLSKEEAKTPVKLQVTEIGAPTIEAEQIPKELQDELRHPLFAEKSQEITDKEEEFLEEASDWENLHSPQEAQEPPVPQEAEFEGEEQFAGREPLSHPSRVQMHLVKKGGGGLFGSLSWASST